MTIDTERLNGTVKKEIDFSDLLTSNEIDMATFRSKLEREIKSN